MNRPSVLRVGKRFFCSPNRAYRAWNPLFHEYWGQSAGLRAQRSAYLSAEIRKDSKYIRVYAILCVLSRCAQGNLILNLSYYKKLANISIMTLHVPFICSTLILKSVLSLKKRDFCEEGS